MTGSPAGAVEPSVPIEAAPPIGGTSGEEIGNAAWVLARWTSISPEDALTLYDGLAEQHQSLISSKAVLAQLADFDDIADPRLRPIMALCQAAMDGDALTQYCQSIVGRERAKGRPNVELRAILERIGAPGTAHAVVDRARGLIPITLLGVLDRLAQAIGFVEIADGIERKVIGTAFLVRRDVVITCAHVAFEPKEKDHRIATEPPLRDISRISFPMTPAGPQDARLSPSNPLLTHSEAHMISVGKLDRLVTAAARNRLDFALLRLDRPIDRVEPIDFSGRDVAADGRLSFLIGFPAHNAAVFDASPIVRSEAVGGRLIHMINSVPGMSGGCVIGDNGVPIGIHEGSIPKLKADDTPEPPVEGREQVENRAVLLKAIAEDIKARSPDLLKLVPPAGLVMYEEALLTRLGRRGAQLLADRVSEAGWDALLASVTRPGPTGPWTAHPCFTDRARARIEKWFVEAAGTMATKSRVAFINGPRGSGKTFMIDVLKRIVPNASTDVVRVAWTEGDTTLGTLAEQLAAAPGDSGTRTIDGHHRYENVPGIVTALAGYGLTGSAPGNRPRPLFVAIDAGDETGSITEPETWIELVAALSRQPWARVVLCGLPGELTRKVEDAVPIDVACEPFEIDHVRGRDIVSFLELFGMEPQATQTPQAAAAAFDAADMPHRQRRELTTAMAALFAIGWHRGVLPVSTEGLS